LVFGQIESAQQRGKFQRGPGRFGAGAAPNRLGARFQQPDDTLIAQLGLAEGNGLVLTEVPDGSVAAKAGFMASDILLKLDGKDVSSTVIEFTSALGAIKADTPIDAVVLRKGKEETIKGIKLPEAPANPRVNPFQRRIQFNLRPVAKQ
jgi:S1-C subfamily serine protease